MISFPVLEARFEVGMKNKKEIEELILQNANKKGNLIPILQKIQDLEGYVSEEAIRFVAERLRKKIAEIYGVLTFYSMFRLKPQGKHIVRVCKGTACHVSGANTIAEAIKDILGLTVQKDTTDDGQFTVMEVACLGCCSLAPVIMIDDQTHGKVTTDNLTTIINNYR